MGVMMNDHKREPTMHAIDRAIKFASNPNVTDGQAVAALCSAMMATAKSFRAEQRAAARVNEAEIAAAYDAAPEGPAFRLVKSGDGFAVEEMQFFPARKKWEYKSVYFSRNKTDAEKALSRRLA